jgi:hypothetical protein
LDDRTERDERHDPDGHRAHPPGSGLDDWIRELAEAALPLTPAQRYTLALLLNSPGPVARPADTAVPHQMPEYLRERLAKGLPDVGRARSRAGGGEGHRSPVAGRLDPA